MSTSETCEGSRPLTMLELSRRAESYEPPPPPPPIDWTFKEALQLLKLQSRPLAPPLVFIDSCAGENTTTAWDFSPVWEYLQEASGGKTAEERLGEYAWVLDYGKRSEDTKLAIAPRLLRLSEEDTAVATSEDSDSGTDSDDFTKAIPPSDIPAVTSKTSQLVPSSIIRKKAAGSLKLLLSHKIPTQYPVKPVPTIPRTFTTNAFNTVQQCHKSSSITTILPLTYETQLQKKRQIVKKLYLHLAEEAMDPEFCPVLGMSPSYPFDFIRLHVAHGGLHVFVDISNIFVGFTEHLRRSRAINLNVRVAQPLFNFTDFAFILERCRPTSRRVLVGSCSNNQKMPYHLEATHCGYEVNLLERVKKPRLPRSVRRMPSHTGYASASDATPMPFSSNVEQGVDEILQMKMLESLVDSEAPSILVLATGDAAVAEYSGGFLINVKRALQKGWSVEIVGWHANMSKAYWKLAEAWPEKLRVIFLDDMAEELLAWYSPEYT